MTTTITVVIDEMDKESIVFQRQVEWGVPGGDENKGFLEYEDTRFFIRAFFNRKEKVD